MNRHAFRCVSASWVMLAVVSALPGQERSERSSGTDQLGSQSGLHAVSVPLDAPIDARSYIVGPGDVFGISISTVPPQVLSLTVSAQGTLMIPLVGEVPATGKSLDTFQSDVLGAINRRYLHAAPSASLLAPRKILVRVRGSSVNEGSYVASASDRVQSLLASGAIRRTTARPDADLWDPDRDLVPVLRRSIRIFRAGSDPIIVDLERYEATRESRWSPYLQEGDEVVFNSAKDPKLTFSVGGAVVLPGTFEWRPGDRLREAIRFAKGFNDHAVPDSIQLLRASGSVEWHTSNSDSEMLPGDRVVVLSRQTRSEEALVTIEGEVRRPGKYPIVSSRTRLSEVMSLAGGVTEAAMTHAMTVYRRAPTGEERALMLLTSERGNAALEDTTYVRFETQARLYGERLGVNIERAISDPASDQNVTLQPGDRILVPRRTGTVYVFGQVRRPGHQPYTPGAGLQSYLDLAGGMTSRAKDDEVSVIKYASRQWLSPDDATVEEGDMIWVPRVVERDVAYQLSLVGQIAGIVSAAATLILLVTQVGR